MRLSSKSLRGIFRSRVARSSFRKSSLRGFAQRKLRAAILLAAGSLCAAWGLAATANRSTLIPFDSQWVAGPDATRTAMDNVHRQVFTALPFLDRIDVFSTIDYHLVHSIAVPSPTTLDISPDGTTLAVGTQGSHILFFSTGTFAKTNDIVFPGSALGVTGFLYDANGNGLNRAAVGLSTGGGVTAYWDHSSNSFLNVSYAGEISPAAYSATGALARSGDYSRILLGDASSAGSVQIVDANTGSILWSTGEPEFSGLGGFLTGMAANEDGSRYAFCVESAGLLILDSSYHTIYKDQLDCHGMIFGVDGHTLYRDVAHDSANYTQALDTTTFAARYVPNYYSTNQLSGYDDILWEASDSQDFYLG